jgi:hypothetical protein
VSERTDRLLALLDVEPKRESYIGELLQLAYGVCGDPHIGPAEALAEIVREARRIASNWQKLRDANADAAWEDFAFYKGNGRWANGASTELAALDARSFATAHDACDAAERLLGERTWDPDYDAPDAARGAMLEAIAVVRAKLKPRPAAGDEEPTGPAFILVYCRASAAELSSAGMLEVLHSADLSTLAGEYEMRGAMSAAKGGLRFVGEKRRPGFVSVELQHGYEGEGSVRIQRRVMATGEAEALVRELPGDPAAVGRIRAHVIAASDVVSFEMEHGGVGYVMSQVLALDIAARHGGLIELRCSPEETYLDYDRRFGDPRDGIDCFYAESFYVRPATRGETVAGTPAAETEPAIPTDEPLGECPLCGDASFATGKKAQSGHGDVVELELECSACHYVYGAWRREWEFMGVIPPSAGFEEAKKKWGH